MTSPLLGGPLSAHPKTFSFFLLFLLSFLHHYLPACITAYFFFPFFWPRAAPCPLSNPTARTERPCPWVPSRLCFSWPRRSRFWEVDPKKRKKKKTPQREKPPPRPNTGATGSLQRHPIFFFFFFFFLSFVSTLRLPRSEIVAVPGTTRDDATAARQPTRSDERVKSSFRLALKPNCLYSDLLGAPTTAEP